MGDFAEMMIDGVLCESCGVFIGPPVGHPRDCASCCPANGFRFGPLPAYPTGPAKKRKPRPSKKQRAAKRLKAQQEASSGSHQSGLSLTNPEM